MDRFRCHFNIWRTLLHGHKLTHTTKIVEWHYHIKIPHITVQGINRDTPYSNCKDTLTAATSIAEWLALPFR